jgi:hypothetical protein
VAEGNQGNKKVRKQDRELKFSGTNTWKIVFNHKEILGGRTAKVNYM